MHKSIVQIGEFDYNMDPNSEIWKRFNHSKENRLIFGQSLLSSSGLDDCFIEDLISEKLIEFSVKAYIFSSSTFPLSLWATNLIDSERPTPTMDPNHNIRHFQGT